MSEFEEFVRSQGFGGDFQRGCNGQYKSDLLHFMEKAFMHQQAKIDEYYETGVALNTETINQRRYILSQSNKINELQKRIDAVLQVLCELKKSLKDFQEMDLYDKGYRVTTEYVIADLEQALRGAND
jgi:hypothetical protein